MTWDQDAIYAQILPIRREIGQRNGPVGVFLVDVRLVDKTVWAIRSHREKAFVILSLMFKCYFGVEMGKRWEELDEEGRGGGMSEAISDAGNDLVVPSSNWTR